MVEISITDAIAAAIDRLAVTDPIAATAWRIRREDRPDDSYFLVLLGDPQRARGVAAVDATTGAVMEWAELPVTGPHLAIDSEHAIRLAGLSGARAALTWRPSRVSPSMLAPVWRVEADEGVRYVDQQGVVHDSLESGPTGG